MPVGATQPIDHQAGEWSIGTLAWITKLAGVLGMKIIFTAITKINETVDELRRSGVVQYVILQYFQ